MKVCPEFAHKWRTGWRPRAALFDLDGTLVQTEHVTKQVLTQWMNRWRSEDVQEIGFDYAGRSWMDLAADLVAQTKVNSHIADVAVALADHYQMIAIDELLEVDGAGAFVQSLQQGLIPMAVVTASTRSFTDQALERLGLSGLIPPSHCVTDDDVERSKPHPEGYLKAADLVGLRPTMCTVFEDSVPGMQAAQAAGCEVIGVLAHAREPAELQVQASGWIHDFASLMEMTAARVGEN